MPKQLQSLQGHTRKAIWQHIWLTAVGAFPAVVTLAGLRWYHVPSELCITLSLLDGLNQDQQPGQADPGWGSSLTLQHLTKPASPMCTEGAECIEILNIWEKEIVFQKIAK